MIKTTNIRRWGRFTTKTTFQLIALAIAMLGSINNAKSKTTSRHLVTVYWFYVVECTPSDWDPFFARVDNTAAPYVGSEITEPFECFGDTYYCAKGFTSDQVDPITHQPFSPYTTASYYTYSYFCPFEEQIKSKLY